MQSYPPIQHHEAEFTETQFFELSDWFKQKGYDVKIRHEAAYVSNGNDYLQAIISGHGLFASFCTPNEDSYRQISGHLAATHVSLFDKWSTVELVVKLPVMPETVLPYLHFVSSEQGRTHIIEKGSEGLPHDDPYD